MEILQGNVLIKHVDKWRGAYYLCDDLQFGLSKEEAGRFYLLKSGSSPIMNADRVSIHSGNRILIVDEDNNLKLVEREYIVGEYTDSFLITNGTTELVPIEYEKPVFLISNRSTKSALKYEWGLDLISDSTGQGGLQFTASDYRPRTKAVLVNGNYGSSCESYINMYRFVLEKVDKESSRGRDNANGSIVESEDNRVEKAEVSSTKNLFEGMKGPAMILLLLIILFILVSIAPN